MNYVLDKKQKKQLTQEFPKLNLNSTVLAKLSLNRLGGDDHTIEAAIEMAIHIHRIHELNQGMIKIGLNDIIDTDIYHRMLEYILDPSKPLSYGERKRLFTEQGKIWNIGFNMSCLGVGSLPLANEIEIMAFGVHTQERKILEEQMLWGEMEIDYGTFYNMLSAGSIDYQKFDDMFTTYIQSVRNVYKKEREIKESPSS
ncbi:MAG: hypothetical protein AAFU57_15800 [Bacteroidota bacterium]